MANRGGPGANPYSSFTTFLPCDLEQVTSLSFSLIIFDEVDVQCLRQELFRDSLRWNIKKALSRVPGWENHSVDVHCLHSPH